MITKKTLLKFVFLVASGIALVFPLASCSQERNTNERQLTFGDGPDQCPCWSPDGRTIAFHSQRGGNVDIWTVPTAGGAPAQLTKTDVDENWPKWSPDGKHVAFVRFTQGANQGWGNLFVMNADGSDERMLTDDGSRKLGLAWFADGKSLAYSEARGTKETFETDLWILDIETKSRQKLLEGYRERTQKGLMVAEVALNSKGDTLVFSGVPEGRPNERWLYVMDVRDKKPRPVVTDLFRPWFASWRPDGQLIAFQSGKLESSEIWVVQPDGESRRKLVSSRSGDRFPCWSPDGKRIAFTRGSREKAHIWIAHLESNPE